MGETINNPQGILGVLKVPGTPKSGNDDILAFQVKSRCFTLISPKNAEIPFFPLLGVPGTFKIH